ncbi:MAG: class I SAM-dependent methyltransferase [Candidatus Margulisiibacteriota bacterium]
MMTDKVRKNEYGFFSAIDMPSKEKLTDYYKENYFQENKGSYESVYSRAEVEYFQNKIEQRYQVIKEHLGGNKKTFLDVGCGEGWALKFFKSKGWQVVGLDYSEYGCKKNNPECADDLIVGDIYENLSAIIAKENRYDVIWLDNVLEHVLDPYKLLKDCRSIISDQGVCVIEVPNDFSSLQTFLLRNGYIDDEFWVCLPDHLHYFNNEGLRNICLRSGWKTVDMISDYPIDLRLMNENTNYVRDKTKGKSCHKERVAVENLMHSISVDKTNNYYRALSELGLGREISGFFMPVKNK